VSVATITAPAFFSTTESADLNFSVKSPGMPVASTRVDVGNTSTFALFATSVSRAFNRAISADGISNVEQFKSVLLFCGAKMTLYPFSEIWEAALRPI